MLLSAEAGLTLLDLGMVPMLLERVQGRLRQVHTAWDFLYPEPGGVAPELLRGEATGESTDVYGLGALLHLLATAAPPYSGSSVVAYNAILSSQKPCDPREHLPDLDAEYAELVIRCLSRDPADRPTMDEVCETLEALAAPLSEAIAPYAPVLRDTSYTSRFEPLLRVVPGGDAAPDPPAPPSPAVVPLFESDQRLTEAELLAQMSPEQRRIYMAGAHADPGDGTPSRRQQLKRGAIAGLIITIIAVLILIPSLTSRQSSEYVRPPATETVPADATSPERLTYPAEAETPSNRYRRGPER